jgi:hypothetical protein
MLTDVSQRANGRDKRKFRLMSGDRKMSAKQASEIASVNGLPSSYGQYGSVSKFLMHRDARAERVVVCLLAFPDFRLYPRRRDAG